MKIITISDILGCFDRDSLVLFCLRCEFIEIVGADSVVYLSLEGLEDVVKSKVNTDYETGHCTACLSGKYPVELESKLEWWFFTRMNNIMFRSTSKQTQYFWQLLSDLLIIKILKLPCRLIHFIIFKTDNYRKPFMQQTCCQDSFLYMCVCLCVCVRMCLMADTFTCQKIMGLLPSIWSVHVDCL